MRAVEGNTEGKCGLRRIESGDLEHFYMLLYCTLQISSLSLGTVSRKLVG